MSKISVAKRNVIILILSLLPFFVGITFSIVKSSDMAYFGVAINISGSQRMRTMLIANYAQQIEDYFIADDEVALITSKKVLSSELDIYERYMEALLDGDAVLMMKENEFANIKLEIKQLYPLFETYVDSGKYLLEVPSDQHSVDFIVQNSLELKNKIHSVVELYQEAYDDAVKIQRTINVIMILLASAVTIFGLLLTRSIKAHEYHANYDYLTKLQNRHNMYDFIKFKSVREYAIFFMDLNKFKVINDTFGHAIGDEILIEVASRLNSVFSNQHIYRFGGDEFVILCHCATGDDLNPSVTIEELIKRTRVEFANAIVDAHGREHYVGFSLGVVYNDVGIEDWDTGIRLADELMYDSKSFAGYVMSCKTNQEVYSRLNLNDKIGDAIRNGNIQPYLMPIYNVRNNNTVIYEALGRWQFEGTEILPYEFIPIIKRNGLSSQYDLNMLRYLDRAYEEHYQGLEETQIPYFLVNILEDTINLAKNNQFLEVLSQMKLPKDKLIISFLEHVLTNDEIVEIINMLKLEGYHFAVDNFSLDITLRESSRFSNIEFIKFNPSVVNALSADQYAKTMLKQFLQMLISLEKKVIIEGVQIEEEVDIIKHMNDELGNDLYYSRP